MAQGGSAETHPAARRVLGRDDPGISPERRRFSGKPPRQSRPRPQGQQRSPDADQTRNHSRHQPLLSRRGCGHSGNQHLQFDRDRAGRLWPRTSGGRAERSRRTDRAGGLRRGLHVVAPPACGGRARPHQPDGVIVARRERRGVPQHHLRCAARNLSRSDGRAHPRRRRSDHDRDRLRHAERQGSDLCDRGSFRANGRTPAGLDFGHDHRSFGPHADRPDGGSVLAFRASRRSLRHRAQLRTGREGTAPLCRRIVRCGRHAGQRPPQCGFAQ